MQIFIAIIFAVLSLPTFAATSASSLKIKVYQVSVSATEACDNPITILSSTAGIETDFMSNPVIGSGTVPDGTYPCLMITMDDVIKYKPLASALPGCVAGTEYTADLCRNLASSGGSGYERYSYTDLLVGTTVTPNVQCLGTERSIDLGGVANKVTLYLRTNAITPGGVNEEFVNSWKSGTTTANSQVDGVTSGPSIDSPNGGYLASPFVVSGTKVGVFYADSTGMIDNNSGDCELSGVLFGFRDP